MTPMGFLKKIAAGVLAVLVLCGMGIFFLCTSPAFLSRAVMLGVNHAQEAVSVSRLAVKKQVCRFPEKLTLQGVSFTLKKENEVYDFRFSSVELKRSGGLGMSRPQMALALQGGSVAAAAFQLEGINAALTSSDGKNWEGPVSVQEARGGGFRAEALTAKARVDFRQAFISDIRGDSCGGTVKGSAVVHFRPAVRYETDIRVENLDTARMREVNDSVFSQLEGRITGTIEIRGPAGGVETIEMDVALSDDSRVKAEALKPLLSHVPQGVQTQGLREAVGKNSAITVYDTSVRLGNRDDRSLSADIRLKSKELNLDIDLTVDIMIEGGMKNFLGTIMKFSQRKKG